jgi:hypothetical protein
MLSIPLLFSARICFDHQFPGSFLLTLLRRQQSRRLLARAVGVDARFEVPQCVSFADEPRVAVAQVSGKHILAFGLIRQERSDPLAG